MTRIFSAVYCISTLISTYCDAQDTLPRFSVVGKPNNRNLISWTNTYPYISQISIQRSPDSTKNFKTILTVPDANVPQNGFVDTKAPAPKTYYRLFIVLDSGKYQFTKSQRPTPDTAVAKIEQVLISDNKRVVLSDSLSNKEVKALKEKLQPVTTAIPKPERFFVVKRKNTYSLVAEKNFKKFRDSIVYATRDTLVFETPDTVLIKLFVPKEVYRPSKYVFTEKFGNVMILLPEASHKKYSVSFFEDNKTPVFEIKEVKSTSLIIDKTNFVHSGWFWFELYEEGSLKERHKFFIPKDF